MRTRIAVSKDGGNLVPRIPVTVDQQSGNEDSGNEIKDGGGGGHLGSNVSRRTDMERLFLSCVCPCICVAPVHTWEMQTQTPM